MTIMGKEKDFKLYILEMHVIILLSIKRGDYDARI